MMKSALLFVGTALLSSCSQTPQPVSQAQPAPRAARPPPAHLAATNALPPPPSASAPEQPRSASAEDQRVIAELAKAFGLYQQFIDKAGSDEAYAQAVTRSKERMEDIRSTLIFLRQGIAEREPR
ncbi:MAG TPA: hypothetical protein VGP93_12625 [Polyangiaceae bacterium]|nr:hypothetical protein [Polyangiaceae bacterium]